MNKLRHVFCIALMSLALSAARPAHADPAAAWQLDPNHSDASFAVTHMGVSEVRGEFTQVTGSGSYDGKSINSATVDATIQVASISTRNGQRDGHLKSGDFFDVEKYPTITFKSKRFRAMDAHKFQLVGDLTIHGVTKTVVLEGRASDVVKDPQGNFRIGASATTTINRKDFGLSWNKAMESGGLLVGDDVRITIDVEFVKKK